MAIRYQSFPRSNYQAIPNPDSQAHRMTRQEMRDAWRNEGWHECTNPDCAAWVDEDHQERERLPISVGGRIIA